MKRGSPTETPEQEANKNNLHILAVDDEKEICHILNTFLSRSGHKVKTVDNGADAIKIIKDEVFDLVLCDLNMQGVRGCEVVRTANSLEKRPKIGIITGSRVEIKPEEGEDFKTDFVLNKPFKIKELAKQINEAFGTQIVYGSKADR